MTRLTWLVVAAAALATGCKERNPLFCENPDHANDPACLSDGGGPCDDTSDCSGNTPLCKIPPGQCVQCLDNVDCGALTPICGDDNACHSCTLDTECGSQVCLDDGSCASSDAVLFAAPTGSDVAGCGLTPGDPCRLDRALLEATETRNLIKLKQGTYPISGGEGLVVDGNNADVTLLAKDAAIDRNADDGPVITMKSGAGLTIIDGTVRDGSGVSGNGITCSNNGKLVLQRVEVTSNDGVGVGTNGCAVTVVNSAITQNNGGGISVANGTFVIVGNFVHLNGTSVGINGGINILASQSATNRLDHNSINRNQAMAGIAGGIQCTVTGFVARDNIVYNNIGAGSNVEVLGTCAHAFSDIGPTAVGAAQDGGNNKNVDPAFVDDVTGNLHVGNSSPVLGGGDPGIDLTGPAATDLDGDARTSPPDIGADEVP
ncbi:MAG TPA: right-handed parallel beta-helix repeat-containing protein [Kofleriaceae bacterium]|nr:right-handed parallel beta-helix repeat-containing protein [Kofleriaceae bacterium]